MKDEMFYKMNRIKTFTDIEIATDEACKDFTNQLFKSLGLNEYLNTYYISTINSLIKSMKNNEDCLYKEDLLFILDNMSKDFSENNQELVRKIIETSPYDKSKYEKYIKKSTSEKCKVGTIVKNQANKEYIIVGIKNEDSFDIYVMKLYMRKDKFLTIETSESLNKNYTIVE